MRPDDLYVPNDMDALRMENELLAFENEYLRARIAEEEALRTAATPGGAEGEGWGRAVPPGSRVVDEEAYEQLRKARSDLLWLIKRMDSSPVGIALRRWEGWRVLTSRYLGESDGSG